MNIILNGKGIALMVIIGGVIYLKGFCDGVKDEQDREEEESKK